MGVHLKLRVSKLESNHKKESKIAYVIPRTIPRLSLCKDYNIIKIRVFEKNKLTLFNTGYLD